MKIGTRHIVFIDRRLAATSQNVGSFLQTIYLYESCDDLDALVQMLTSLFRLALVLGLSLCPASQEVGALTIMINIASE